MPHRAICLRIMHSRAPSRPLVVSLISGFQSLPNFRNLRARKWRTYVPRTTAAVRNNDGGLKSSTEIINVLKATPWNTNYEFGEYFTALNAQYSPIVRDFWFIPGERLKLLVSLLEGFYCSLARYINFSPNKIRSPMSICSCARIIVDKKESAK